MILKNFLWDYSGRLVTIAFGLVVTGILSRILTPIDYGAMSLVMATSGIASIFSDLGFGSAIIQQPDITQRQVSTIFFLNWIIGIFLYFIVFISSVTIAAYYNDMSLSILLKVASLSLIINSLNVIPSSLIQKQMLFRQQTIRNICITVVSGGISIWMVFKGYGIWALVFQNILSALASLITNVIIAKWRPIIYFKLSEIKNIFNYSFYLFLSNILNNIFVRVDVFLIGKVFNLTILGHYTRAQGLDQMVRGLSTSSLLSVLFPYFSKIKNNIQLVVKQWYNFFNLICFIFLLFTGYAFISSRYLFHMLFGTQWIISSDYYKLLALASFAYPLSGLALTILEALGHSKKFFQVEVMKKVAMLPAFLVACYFGIYWFLIATLFFYTVALFLNLYFLKSVILFSIKKCIIDLSKFLFILSSFILICYFVDYSFLINSVSFSVVMIMNIVFSIYFITGVYFLKSDTFSYVYDHLKQYTA